MKDQIQEQHSLILFIAYIISINIKPNGTVIDSIVIALLFGYVVFDKFLKYKTLPDIRAEVLAELEKHKISQNEKARELESQIKSCNASVNQVINLKSVNGVAGSVKF